MTSQADKYMVTRESFGGHRDALWRVRHAVEGGFVITIDRLGCEPPARVWLSDQNIAELRDKFGPAFDPAVEAVVLVEGAVRVGDQGDFYEMVATRRAKDGPIKFQAIGQSVTLLVHDRDWVACRERLGIGRVMSE